MYKIYGALKNIYKTKLNSRLKNFIKTYVFKSRKIGLISETYYWDNALNLEFEHSEGIDRCMDKGKREGAFPKSLLAFIKEIKEYKDSAVKVLDVGSGPVSTLAWGVDQNLINVVAIDPLAHEYSKLMKRKNLDYPIIPIQGKGEELTKLFLNSKFDIVYSRNALDHSSSPLKCLNEMFALIDPGGFIYLEGVVNVGAAEDWKGLHQHNLIPENGHLVHYNKNGKLTNLTNGHKLKCVHQNKEKYQISDWYEIVFKKLE